MPHSRRFVLAFGLSLIAGGWTLFAQGTPAGATAAPAWERLPLNIVEHRAAPAGAQEVPLLTVGRMDDFRPEISLPSPYQFGVPIGWGQLDAFLAGKLALKGARAEAETFLVLAERVHNNSATPSWSPVSLSRSGRRLLLEVESFQDDFGNDKNLPTRDVWLLSLGQLPAGTCELAVRETRFFFTANRDKSRLLDQYAWHGRREGAVTFEVAAAGAESKPAALREADLKDMQELRTPDSSVTWQVPRYSLVELDVPPQNRPALGLRLDVGAGDLDGWLKKPPTRFQDYRDVVARLAPLARGKQTYALLLGPKLNSGEWMTLRQVTWNGRSITLHAEIFRDNQGRDENIARFPLIVAQINGWAFPVAGENYEVKVEWTPYRSATPGGSYKSAPDETPDLTKAIAPVKFQVRAEAGAAGTNR